MIASTVQLSAGSRSDDLPLLGSVDELEIDSLNDLCYSALAQEYDLPAHATCRDFDKFTTSFLTVVREFLRVNNLRYLDIGVGTGKSLLTLMQWLTRTTRSIDVVDISAEMLHCTRTKVGTLVSAYHHTSIHTLKLTKRYDLIVATMADPFLTHQALIKIADLLTPGGYFIVTLPSHTWATRVRGKEINRCRFLDSKGDVHSSFSVCWSPQDLIAFLEERGLQNKLFAQEFLSELDHSTLSFLHKTLVSRYSDTAYCTGYVFRKVF